MVDFERGKVPRDGERRNEKSPQPQESGGMEGKAERIEKRQRSGGLRDMGQVGTGSSRHASTRRVGEIIMSDAMTWHVLVFFGFLGTAAWILVHVVDSIEQWQKRRPKK